MTKVWRTVLAAAVIMVSACTADPNGGGREIEAPIGRSFYLFRYVGGADIREGCVAGAPEEREYRQLLTDAGFHDIDLEITRVYDPNDLAAAVGDDAGCCGAGDAFDAFDATAYARYAASGGQLVSAFVRAKK